MPYNNGCTNGNCGSADIAQLHEPKNEWNK